MSSLSDRPIYLDHGATTPLDARVLEAMMPWLTTCYGNPASSSHPYGWEAEDAVERGRAEVAALVGAEPREIAWTSGATESDNLALLGVAAQLGSRGRHLITVRTEHKAILDTCQHLARQGYELTLLDVDEGGRVDPDDLRRALRPDTILCSIMHVNNETGVVQDIAELGRICREQGVLMHVDAAQSAGKLPIDLGALPVDLMSFSAHKVYGPKGMGALYVRRKPPVRLQAQIHGGGHERGLRSGTLPTHQIVGMGAAFRLAGQEMAQEVPRIAALRDRLWAGLEALGGVRQNGDPGHRTAHHLNVAFDGLDSESLMLSLPTLAVSSGSACTSASLSASHVLRAMGLSEARANSSLRFVLGRHTSQADIDHALSALSDAVARLRRLAPPSEAAVGRTEA